MKGWRGDADMEDTKGMWALVRWSVTYAVGMIGIKAARMGDG